MLKPECLYNKANLKFIVPKHAFASPRDTRQQRRVSFKKQLKQSSSLSLSGARTTRAILLMDVRAPRRRRDFCERNCPGGSIISRTASQTRNMQQADGARLLRVLKNNQRLE
jgi:hypothetical protein